MKETKKQTETEQALRQLLKAERRRVRQLKAQMKYHKRAFRTLSTKVTAKAAEDFAEVCKQDGMTIHAALKGYTERATDEGTLKWW